MILRISVMTKITMTLGKTLISFDVVQEYT